MIQLRFSKNFLFWGLKYQAQWSDFDTFPHLKPKNLPLFLTNFQSALGLDISVLESVSFSVLNCFHFQYSILFKNIQDWIFIPFLDELDNSKHLKLKTLKRWFSAQNPIMCAIFGPKNGDFQKMLRIVWNGKKCNKVKKS